MGGGHGPYCAQGRASGQEPSLVQAGVVATDGELVPRLGKGVGDVPRGRARAAGRDCIQQCRRQQVAAAWYTVSSEPIGDSAGVGRELASFWGRLYRLRQQADADVGEFLTYVQEGNGPQWEWQSVGTQELASASRDSVPGLDVFPYAW